MEGWIFDVYPDRERGLMVTWILTEKGRVRREEKFMPRMYVGGCMDDLGKLKEELASKRAIGHLDIVRRRTDIRDLGTSPVLDIGFRDYGSITDVARHIDARGRYRDFTLYNVDQSLPFRYLLEKDLFPNALVHMGKELRLVDNCETLDYPVPPFRAMSIKRKKVSSLKDREGIGLLTVTESEISGTEREMSETNRGILGTKSEISGTNGEISGTESEISGTDVEILSELSRMIEDDDPDILLTDDGDHFLMPFLHNRAISARVPFSLHRDTRVRAPYRRKERSYFTYGRIVYKPAPFLLKGRGHIDRSSFMWRASGLYGLVDLSRLSGIPVQQLSRLSPGTAISAMQIRRAIRDGYVIMWKKNQPETFKTALELLNSDRGGFIFEPKVGIFENVTEVDFTSMYPSIIHNYNISPETMLCKCCPDSPRVVPALGYHICTRRTGLLPRVLAPLVERRLHFKRRAKEGGDGAERARQISDILKWLLVTCFGYTGYKNARFGKIECHEAITAYGRDILLDAMRIANEYDLTVLHGIVDSLWLEGDPKRAFEAAARIGKKIGIPMEVEGTYKWIVFLPNKQNGIGALNRYYGMFEDGGIKARGVELRRRDTPKFLCDFQWKILKMLGKADTKEDFLALVPECIDEGKDAAAVLRKGDVDPTELVFTKIVSKGLSDYTTVNDQSSCLSLLAEEGITVAPGQNVRFVVTDAGAKDARKRVVPDILIGPDTQYDRNAYVRYLARCLESLFLPFGWTEERVLKRLEDRRETFYFR